jgi:hypothetical protein
LLWHLFFAAQDDFAAISSGLVAGAVVLVLTLTQRKRGKKRILITDYRCGIRFVNGGFVALLPPGSYRFNPERDQITIIDMRPQPILIERQVFQDAVGAQSVISIGTELVVSDPVLVANALRDQIKDAYVIVRDTLRAAAPRQVVAGMGDNRKSIEEALTKVINTELAKVGMRVPEIEITELWAAAPVLSRGPASGVVQ